MVGRVLLTGGNGFIGSHILVELIKIGIDCIVLDNLINSDISCIKSCEKIVGKEIQLEILDLLDYEKLYEFLKKNKIDIVIHLASLKSVSESVSFPLMYYENNVVGSINLLRAMTKCGIRNIVFSSSSTVYGDPHYLPIDEKHVVGNCANSYGWSKMMIERIIEDHMKSINGSYIFLRYFNPVGAHESGLIGERPNGIPQNLFPYVALVANGKLPYLNVFGNDYNTRDGTCIRDYIHVTDLSLAHLNAVKMILDEKNPIQKIYNLGTGNGFSVLEVVKAYEKACGKEIAYKIISRRPGDICSSCCEYKLALNELNWKPIRGLDKMCEDSWRWIQKDDDKNI